MSSKKSPSSCSPLWGKIQSLASSRNDVKKRVGVLCTLSSVGTLLALLWISGLYADRGGQQGDGGGIEDFRRQPLQFLVLRLVAASLGMFGAACGHLSALRLHLLCEFAAYLWTTISLCNPTGVAALFPLVKETREGRILLTALSIGLLAFGLVTMYHSWSLLVTQAMNAPIRRLGSRGRGFSVESTYGAITCPLDSVVIAASSGSASLPRLPTAKVPVGGQSPSLDVQVFHDPPCNASPYRNNPFYYNNLYPNLNLRPAYQHSRSFEATSSFDDANTPLSPISLPAEPPCTPPYERVWRNLASVEFPISPRKPPEAVGPCRLRSSYFTPATIRKLAPHFAASFDLGQPQDARYQMNGDSPRPQADARRLRSVSEELFSHRFQPCQDYPRVVRTCSEDGLTAEASLRPLNEEDETFSLTRD